MCIVLVKALDARNFFKSSFTAPIYGNMGLRCKLNKPVFSFRRRKYLSIVEINGAF